jgi:hypothetical protein
MAAVVRRTKGRNAKDSRMRALSHRGIARETQNLYDFVRNRCNRMLRASEAVSPRAISTGLVLESSVGRSPAAETSAYSFHAPDGTHWHVREFQAGDTRVGGAGAACLTFESDGVVRRVYKYPPDWRALSPEELLELSWSR